MMALPSSPLDTQTPRHRVEPTVKRKGAGDGLQIVDLNPQIATQQQHELWEMAGQRRPRQNLDQEAQVVEPVEGDPGPAHSKARSEEVGSEEAGVDAPALVLREVDALFAEERDGLRIVAVVVAVEVAEVELPHVECGRCAESREVSAVVREGEAELDDVQSVHVFLHQRINMGG